MRLVCPHCQSPADVDEGNLSDVVLCSSCGSSFGIAGVESTIAAPRGAGSLGKFDLLSGVGSGAFGTVYKARDRELDRTVAVKVPRSGSFSNHEEQERFLREARSVAQLRHPSIVSVFEVGQSDGTPYLVSEFVDGMTLADDLTGAKPSAREAAELIARVADALEYAHSRQESRLRPRVPGTWGRQDNRRPMWNCGRKANRWKRRRFPVLSMTC